MFKICQVLEISCKFSIGENRLWYYTSCHVIVEILNSKLLMILLRLLLNCLPPPTLPHLNPFSFFHIHSQGDGKLCLKTFKESKLWFFFKIPLFTISFFCGVYLLARSLISPWLQLFYLYDVEELKLINS